MPLFLVLLSVLQCLQKLMLKSPSSIWCWHSNSRSLEHKSLCITTRPGELKPTKQVRLAHREDWLAFKLTLYGTQISSHIHLAVGGGEIKPTKKFTLLTVKAGPEE